MTRALRTLALCLALASALTVAGQATKPPIEPGDGIIDGRSAMMVTPVSYRGRQISEYLPADGLEAHLVDPRKPDVELVYPAGEWFFPPAGIYDIWAEADGLMSPRLERVSYSPYHSRMTGMMVPVTLAPAGGVLIADPWAAQGGQVRLLRAAPGPGLARQMERRAPAAAIGPRGLQLPVGPAVASLWGDDGEVLALSRKFQIPANGVVTAPLERPAAGSHLLLQLRRHADAARIDDFDVEFQLRIGDKKRLPDLTVDTRWTAWAMWYDLPPGPADLSATSAASAMVPEELELPEQGIVARSLQLLPLRQLRVDLDVVAPITEEAVILRVRRLPVGTVLAEHRLKPGEASHRFERLVPTLVEVAMETSLGTVRRRVDLREVEEGYLRIEPDLLKVWGEVRHGDQGHAARLSFLTVQGEKVEVVTDDAGFYEAGFLAPLRGVEVTLTDSDVAPHVDFFRVPIATDRELAFHLPDVDNVVEVLDAQTGNPISAALVTVRNEYEEVDESSGETVGRAVAQRQPTDEEGVARLAPFRPGRVELRASGDGYAPLAEPVVAEVEDPEEDRRFRIVLEPLGDTTEVQIRLPGGAGAAGAEILLSDSLDGGRVLFSGRADADGFVEIPTPPDRAFVLVRHPSAASEVRPWPAEHSTGATTWTLRQGATPLSLEVTSGGGGQVPRADLAVWFDGHRVSGTALAWLTTVRASTDQSGQWVGYRLPAADLAILAISPRHRDALRLGELDTLATPVSYPWPSQIMVEAVR